MTEQEWLACNDPEAMVKFLGEKASPRKLRLFGCECCRTVWESFRHEEARRAVQLAERAADGGATQTDLQTMARALWPSVNNQYHAFRSERSEGPGTTYAMMAATAILYETFMFTNYWFGGEMEALTAWACVAMARAQTAKVTAQERRWQELEDSGISKPDKDGWLSPPNDAWAAQNARLACAARDREREAAQADHAGLLRDVIGPAIFRSVPLRQIWLTGNVVNLAQSIYDRRAFDRMPILADALEDAGCDNPDILNHCRQPSEHVRGCWVIDLLLGKS